MQYYVYTGEISCLKADCGQIPLPEGWLWSDSFAWRLIVVRFLCLKADCGQIPLPEGWLWSDSFAWRLIVVRFLCLKADCGQIPFVHNLGSGGKGDNPYWVRHSGLCAVEWETQQEGKEGIDWHVSVIYSCTLKHCAHCRHRYSIPR